MRTLRISASALALAVGLAAPGVAAAQAQPQTAAPDAAPPAPADDQAAASGDIVVTGVRASLERSIAIQRNSNGKVEAI